MTTQTPSTPGSPPGVEGLHTREHWLLFNPHRRIIGCHCGFVALADDEGWGDSVIEHIAEEAAKVAEGRVQAEYEGKFHGERGEPGEVPSGLSHVTYRVERDAEGKEVRIPAPVDESDIVSSELTWPVGMHGPAIDIDVPIRAVESSTPGHFHLYIDVPMTWARYEKLLQALVDAGLVESGYLKVSLFRGGTHLRLPWVRKPAA